MAWVEYSRDAIGNRDGHPAGTAYLRCSRCRKIAAVPLFPNGQHGANPGPCCCEVKR